MEQVKAFGEQLWKMSALWQMKVCLSCIILLRPAAQSNTITAGLVLYQGQKINEVLISEPEKYHKREIQYFYGARSSLAAIWYCSIEVNLIYASCSSGQVYSEQESINKNHAQNAW